MTFVSYQHLKQIAKVEWSLEILKFKLISQFIDKLETKEVKSLGEMGLKR